MPHHVDPLKQFRFLKRLLLVHGHWSYARNGTMQVYLPLIQTLSDLDLLQDRQLLLQEHCGSRSSLVVPNLLWLEFGIVRPSEHDPLLTPNSLPIVLLSTDRKSTRLNSSHLRRSRMPSSA